MVFMTLSDLSCYVDPMAPLPKTLGAVEPFNLFTILPINEDGDEK
jgi:hypothetical protein